jgi:Fe-S cluster assembly protein SufD
MTQVADTKSVLHDVWKRWMPQSEVADSATLWLSLLRDSASEAIEQLRFPTTRDEAWRLTNLASMIRIPFQPTAIATDSIAAKSISSRQIAEACYGLADAHRLVFVNGRFVESLSTIGSLPTGVFLGNLSKVGTDGRNRIENRLGRVADFRHRVFIAINTACLHDAAVLFLPPGGVVDRPIHLLFVSFADARPVVSHPHVLIVADKNSQATILESYAGIADAKQDVKDSGIVKRQKEHDASIYFTNGVTEVVLDDGALIEHIRFQNEDATAFHLGTTQVHLNARAKYHSHVIASGAKLCRHELNVVLDGEDCECRLNGLAVARGRQLIDNQTRIEHVKPRCTSRELYKAVVDDDAHGVFSGKIHVHADAQKTDARQASHTLLLSDDAVMNSQPHLEIYADDVKCTHGATIGNLDESSLFYLRSRGIGSKNALDLLTFAFMNEILTHIPHDAVRDHLEARLLVTPRLDE